ncbi:molybdopterin oxidoreductase family protein [Phragmitibacter flavus]|nr:molybdopterin-dependent oxidoreductase [Phragmitibacter flavus]
MKRRLDFKLPGLLRSLDGPMTRELVQSPGKFGFGNVPLRMTPHGTVTSVCGFCSTGCGLKVHVDERGQAINLTADSSYPVNLGMACPKGWEALTPLGAKDRAVVPMLDGNAVDWDEALQVFCRRFGAIMDQHGAESVAFLSTGQIMCEEMFFLGALAKFGMGMVHGDGNTRQCMATAVTAYKESFGFDAPPYTYADFEESDVLVFVGANPCIAHPIMWQRVERNRHGPEIVVIDPRKTETAMAATQHLAIKPKSDLVLFYCLAHWLVVNGRVDLEYVERHVDGYVELVEFLKDFEFADHLEVLGLSAEEFELFARTVANGKRVSFWWTMGVNQGHEATRTAQAIINVALMTGNMGRPGTGANSITGQCNAMGSRLFSNTTNLLGGHDFTKAEHREKVAGALGMEVGRIPDRGSWAYDQIIEGIGEGKIKGLWMVATNGAHSWMNQKRFKELVGKLDFFVVQDMFGNTESAQLADLVLPAAGWGEKEGTFINSERRFGLGRKVSRAPGQALADFHIFRLVAEYWGCGELFRGWTSPEVVFEKMKAVSVGQPCEISGIEGYAMLAREGGVQWPLKAGDGDVVGKERRLFEDGLFFTANGRARLVFETPREVPEKVSEEYPLVLLTGRGTSAQWHTQTRTSKSAILRKLYSEELWVEVHPADAEGLGVVDGKMVRVVSRRGTVEAVARVTATVGRGQVFLPMHYAQVNELTIGVVDPYSRQPNYKFCAVRVEKDLR